MLGQALVPLWRAAGADVTAWTRADVDVTNRMALLAAVKAFRPDVLVHAAAWTNVDGAEADESAALRVNRDGTINAAAACAEVGAAIVYVSTDYAFDGTARAPIAPATPVRPLGAYARTKVAGEAAVRAGAAEWLIARTGWLYGPGGRNFVDTMRARAAEGATVKVVDDQVGAPTSVRLLAEVLWALVQSAARGVFHVAAAGETSWHGVARAVYEAAGKSAALVRSCSTAEFPRPATRPAYSVLDCSATVARLGAALPPWPDQVLEYVRTGALAPAGFVRHAAPQGA